MFNRIGYYEIIFCWDHLRWDFESHEDEKKYYDNEFYKGAMPAGIKMDSMGNYYMSVPRWNDGIPATFNKVVMKCGKPLLQAYPSWEMNKVGDPNALQSVLGYEIDENDVLWLLDQGHVMGETSIEGSQKIIKWDIKTNQLIDTIIVPEHIASYTGSFLNDIVVDNINGFAHITDSGIYVDPLEGGIIVLNTKTDEMRRVLNQHESTQDVKDYWFEIDGVKVWRDEPFRVAADGIALSADRKKLYWTPLTSRNLYSIDTELLRNFNTSDAVIENAVRDLGSKGTNSDGMAGDNFGRIWYSMLEGMGLGYYDPTTNTMNDFISDKRMNWVDTLQVINSGHILFNSNQLHLLNRGELDYFDPCNLILWRACIGNNVKSYLCGPIKYY